MNKPPGRRPMTKLRVDMGRIVILTGAGISAESGLGTFRDADGLWTKYNLDEVATPEGFARNPTLVHEFYNMRRKMMVDAKPNAAHYALARLEAAAPESVLLVTQNIDNLHERAGSRTVVHMHGELLKALCTECGARHPCEDALSVETTCPACGSSGGMRPNVVWFGEVPHQMDRIYDALTNADLFVSIGTSGQVYPAAGFVFHAAKRGVRTLELNLETTSPVFDESREGPATGIVPTWVEEILARL